MLPITQRMELLSRAYFQAIVAQAGGTWAVPIPDFGIDFSIHHIGTSSHFHVDEGDLMHVQLKCTAAAQYREKDDCFIHDLEIKAYDFLRIPNVKIPRLLVYYVMPADESLWLSQDHEGLTLRHCAYYASLAGLPATANERTVRITIPRRQVFSVEYLRTRFQERQS
jgi:Domain of unknown function (DUF4365)